MTGVRQDKWQLGSLDDARIAALEDRARQPPAQLRERLWLAGAAFQSAASAKADREADGQADGEADGQAKAHQRPNATYDPEVGFETQPDRQTDSSLVANQTGAIRIGSIDPLLSARMAEAGLPLQQRSDGWAVIGPPDKALARIARWLGDHALISRWRDELVDVPSLQGPSVARIERAAVRALGITTQAVHLVGLTPDGTFWVQQRALDKATDPGLWDTLMGGLIGAGESIGEALARETQEEAGLAIQALRDLQPRGRLTVRRPVPDGYMVEHVEIYEAVVPSGVVPVNQDGEVERFECLEPGPLRKRLQAGGFTLEAALILTGALRRQADSA